MHEGDEPRLVWLRRANAERKRITDRNVLGRILSGDRRMGVRKEGQEHGADENKGRQRRPERSEHRRSILWQPQERVYGDTADPELEVQVWTGRVAGAAKGTDRVALADVLSLAHPYLR